jgi:ankyrin repeat protein
MSQDPTADLFTAVRQDQLEVVSQALIAGADVNATESEGWTPLHLAAGKSKTPALLEALLKAGANVHARASFGKTPLHFAASSNSNPAVLEVLLKAGAKVDAKDSMYGGTPLYWAAQFNEASAVLEVLLKAGANPRAGHESGATPYDVAKPQHREILRKAMLMRPAF